MLADLLDGVSAIYALTAPPEQPREPQQKAPEEHDEPARKLAGSSHSEPSTEAGSVVTHSVKSFPQGAPSQAREGSTLGTSMSQLSQRRWPTAA